MSAQNQFPRSVLSKFSSKRFASTIIYFYSHFCPRAHGSHSCSRADERQVKSEFDNHYCVMESQNKSLVYRLSRSSSSSHLTLHPTHCRSFVCSYIPATNQLPKSVLKKNRFRDKPYFHSPPCLIALSSLYRFHRFCSRPLAQDRLLKSVLRKVFFFHQSHPSHRSNCPSRLSCLTLSRTYFCC